MKETKKEMLEKKKEGVANSEEAKERAERREQLEKEEAQKGLDKLNEAILRERTLSLRKIKTIVFSKAIYLNKRSVTSVDLADRAFNDLEVIKEKEGLSFSFSHSEEGDTLIPWANISYLKFYK